MCKPNVIGQCMLAIILLLVPFTVHAELSAADILRRSDAIRNPSGGFLMHATITEFQQGVKDAVMSASIRSQPDKQSGQYRTLVDIESPTRDRGKRILRNGLDLWFYDPASQASVRISPQQRLLGQASNGDVMSSNFALDYDSRLLATETVRDGYKKHRETFSLELIANNDQVSYPRIIYWADAVTFAPVKAKFYAASGRLLKVVYYRHFESILGRERPTEVLIIDGLDTRKVTRMQFSKYRQVATPDAWFQRAYLPLYQP